MNLPNLEVLARWLVIGGIGIVILGGILWLVSRIPGLNGLPGTIKIEGSGFSCVFPLLACIVISIVLTVLLNLAARLFK
jgi:hypothetical protein